VGYEDLRVSREGATAVITLDRPKVNALRAQTMEELTQAATAAQADPTVRVIIITGAGEKAFSGGADLASAFRGDVKPGSGGETIESGLEKFHETLDRLEAGKPTIAALNGVAFGGGCELALGCHFRVMDPRAEIGLTETNVGIFPAGGGTQRLPRLVGVGRALDMIVFGRRVGAEEAERIGLATRGASRGRPSPSRRRSRRSSRACASATRWGSPPSARASRASSRRRTRSRACRRSSRSAPPSSRAPEGPWRSWAEPPSSASTKRSRASRSRSPSSRCP
jgi:enoyl-CoA hydratase/carnithine racemase